MASRSSPAKPAKIIQLDEGWARIKRDGIEKLQRMIAQLRSGKKGEQETFTNSEYSFLYSTVYTMSIQKSPYCFTADLYNHYRRSVTEYLSQTVLPAIQKSSGEQMVLELVSRWEDHQIMSQWFVKFFIYLDRFYVKRNAKDNLEQVCLNRFRELIFDVVKGRTTSALLVLIQRDRTGEQVDRSLLKKCIGIYVAMDQGEENVYLNDFQAPFLQATVDLYGREAANWLSHDSCPEYLRKTQARLEDERQRLAEYLHPSSEEKLFAALYETLLIRHQADILGKERTGVQALLESNATGDLTRMFSLYNCVPKSLEPIAEALKNHIVSVGQALVEKVNSAKNHDTYISELIKVHEKYYDLVLNCFKGHAVLQKSLKQSFETLVNIRTYQSTTAELLADFSDKLLRKGGMKLEEAELQRALDNAVRLFAYLTDKDMFSEFYRKLLSKRLLLQASEDMASEKSMIGKLKVRCGALYTTKFEGMINDMRNAEDHVTEFAKFCNAGHIDLKCDFQVQTLTSVNWPTYPVDEIILPLAMSKCVEAFKGYYDSKTNNRKLTWIHRLGMVTLAGAFKTKTIDLVVSSIQASLLLLLNDEAGLEIKELQKHTGLDAEQMKRQLRSMVSGKFKVLIKTPFKGYSEKDRISINENFTSQQRRIRLPNAVTKTSTDEREKAHTDVEEGRRHAIEANVVRIMKARKTLTHQRLVAEVSKHLMEYFKPDPRQIKKRIEDLIAREYLERDKDQSSVYHYLA